MRAGFDEVEKVFGLRNAVAGSAEMICAPEESGVFRFGAIGFVVGVCVERALRRFVQHAGDAVVFRFVQIDDVVVVREVNDGVEFGHFCSP